MESKALGRAMALIADGTLSIDGDGRIWRHRIDGKGGRGGTFPRRAESNGGNGYFRLMLWIDGALHGIGAHRVVWAHFHGPIPEGAQINHLDLNKRNNRRDNLEIVTGAQNIQHSYANGRARPWSAATEWRTGRQKLTAAQIDAAKQMRASGVKLRDIAARLGIGTTHAHRITSA